MAFERIAVTKLNHLLADAKFSNVASVGDDKITLVFQANRTCEIDKWGRVTWLSLDEVDNKKRTNH